VVLTLMRTLIGISNTMETRWRQVINRTMVKAMDSKFMSTIMNLTVLAGTLLQRNSWTQDLPASRLKMMLSY
jgi:hypothetical protein